MKKFLFYLISVSVLFIGSINATELPQLTNKYIELNDKVTVVKPRTFSFDSNYRYNLATNRSLANYLLEVQQGSGWLYEASFSSTQWGSWSRVFPYFLYSLVKYKLDFSLSVAYHELGHAGKYSAFGYKPVFVLDSSNIVYSNFFSYQLALLTNPIKQPGCGREIIEYKYIDDKYLYSASSLEQEIIVSSGGLNNNAFVAKSYENAIWYNGNGHVTDMLFYLDNKYHTYLYALVSNQDYSDADLHNIAKKMQWHNINNLRIDEVNVDGVGISDDLVGVLSAYKAQGINGLTYDKLKEYSLITSLLSAQNYSFIFALYDYLSGSGDGKVTALSYKGILLPNFATYFTTKGLSVQASSGYKLNDSWYFPFAVEYLSVAKDQNVGSIETSIGVRKIFKEYNNSYLHAEGTVATTGINYSVYATANFDYNMFLQAGVSRVNALTMFGERHASSFEKNKLMNYEFWLRFGFNY